MSKIRKNNWTEEEKRAVIKAVKKHPNNLSYAFIMASQVINRTPQAISTRWYQGNKGSALPLRRERRNIFNLRSSLSNSSNLKVLRTEYIKDDTDSVWTKIRNFLNS